MTVKTRQVFDQYLKIAGIILCILFIAELTVSLITIHHINRQLGFSCATPETPAGELFEVQQVLPGSVMAQAGLRPFDRIQMNNVNHLYLLLIRNQGREAPIPVWRDKKIIVVRVKVPALDVPLADISFLF